MENSQSGPPITRSKLFRSRLFGLAIVLGVIVLLVGGAQANILCRLFLQCFYQSPGFKIRVMDKETGQPLADVHALAEWIQYGMHGQYPGLMAQDAVSGTDGWLVFPPWGPTRGSSEGLYTSQDPAIILYKMGYQVTTLINRVGPESQYDRVKGFAQDGQTFAVELFRGNSDEREKQLFEARGRGAPTRKESMALFGEPYLNRRRRIRAELELQPQRYEVQIDTINREIKNFEEANR